MSGDSLESPQATTPRSTAVVKKKYRSVSCSFKSPLLRDVSKDDQVKTEEELKEEIDEMKKKEELINGEIEELEGLGYREEELQLYIVKLHEYNEMKDLGQMLLGRIAMQRGVTVRSLYEEYNLGLED